MKNSKCILSSGIDVPFVTYRETMINLEKLEGHETLCIPSKTCNTARIELKRKASNDEYIIADSSARRILTFLQLISDDGEILDKNVQNIVSCALTFDKNCNINIVNPLIKVAGDHCKVDGE